MATKVQSEIGGSTVVSTLGALVAAEGTGTHGYVHGEELLRGRHAPRNMSDAIHMLCGLHGRFPGVVDLATSRSADPVARSWTIASVDAFAVERSYLARLVVAAGPMPSTPGQAESEAAVGNQHHALEMLARSDRNGCAMGAAAALAIDWHAVRPLLDHAAHRFGIAIPVASLPSVDETLEICAAIASTSAIERAVAFGAQQLLGQHRGLWDLLEARQLARGDY